MVSGVLVLILNAKSDTDSNGSFILTDKALIKGPWVYEKLTSFEGIMGTFQIGAMIMLRLHGQ